jgi:hypothetical protein
MKLSPFQVTGGKWDGAEFTLEQLEMLVLQGKVEILNASFIPREGDPDTIDVLYDVRLLVDPGEVMKWA